MPDKTPMDKEAAARVQSSTVSIAFTPISFPSDGASFFVTDIATQSFQAKSGGNLSSDSFPARAQSAADKNAAAAADSGAGASTGSGSHAKAATSGGDKAPAK